MSGLRNIRLLVKIVGKKKLNFDIFTLKKFSYDPYPTNYGQQNILWKISFQNMYSYYMCDQV